MNLIWQYGSVADIPLYNCTNSPTFGQRRETIGVISMVYGMVASILFIQFLYIMLQPDLIKMSCYKIMFFVGVVDVMALLMCAVFTGFLAIQGAVYCTYPTAIYYFGSAGLSLWCCSCLANILLLINRILNMKNAKLADKIFGGRRIYILLLLPLTYGLYFFIFTKPVLFTSLYYAWFFDPFIFPDRSLEYSNNFHSFNNIAIVVLTCFLYVYVGILVIGQWKKSNVRSKNFLMSNNILHQALVICALDQFSSTVYVAMNFIQLPEVTVIIAQHFWEAAHGFPVITYLTMNHTLRHRFFNLLLRIK